MTTPITLTTDRRALCVRASYKHRDIMLALPKHLRRGVHDETGFWWRVPLAGYDVVAFALPDASVDYDVLVALDGVDTRTEVARMYKTAQPIQRKNAQDVLLVTAMSTDNVDKMVAFGKFAAKHAADWQAAERKRGRR
jgi:hypothetical protein